MKNRELIRHVLHARLMDESIDRGTVSVLSGPWGCGKTYLWLHDILPQLTGRSTITLSLFGLESIAALKTQLMNQCLVLKARALGTGSVKRALSGGKNLLLEGFKKAIMGVDSVIGTNLLSWNIDPLQLVDDNLIVCLDDIERISSKVGLDEVFGLTNYLAEHKRCRILLIMNEEALLKEEDSNAKTMKKYKERVVDYHLLVDTDLFSAFDLFTSQYDNKTEIYDYFHTNKPFILQSMLASKCSNLRTLKKSIEAIAEVLFKEGIKLEPKLIPSFVSFQIEASEGKLRQPDFYNFNEMALMISSKIIKQNKDQGGRQEEQREFHQLYFGNAEGYHFVEEFYNRIKYGYFDWNSLKNEINPEASQVDDLNVTLAAAQSREWWYFSDEEYAEWIRKIEEYLFSERLIQTSQLVDSIVYLKYASERSGIDLEQETEDKIRERLSKNALLGDESFTHENRMLLSQQKDVWEPYLDGYNKIAEAAAIKSSIPDIVKAIKEENIGLFLEHMKQKPKGLIASLSEDSLSALRQGFEKNRMFFNDAVTFINEELLTYRTAQIIPKVEDKLFELRDFVGSFLDRKDLDNSDRLRLERLLETIPIVGKEQQNK